MVGYSRGQGVSLHRNIYQLGASTNPNKCFILITVPCTGLLAHPSCFRTLAVDYISLQLTKSLSINVVSLHLIWIVYSQP